MYGKEDQETHVTEYTIEITHTQYTIENTHYLHRTGKQNSANRKTQNKIYCYNEPSPVLQNEVWTTFS